MRGHFVFCLYLGSLLHVLIEIQRKGLAFFPGLCYTVLTEMGEVQTAGALVNEAYFSLLNHYGPDFLLTKKVKKKLDWVSQKAEK